MDRDLYRKFFEIENHFWWSVGTRRIFFQLIGALPPSGRGRVLDVGCGTGVHLQEFPSGWRMVAGCDRSELALSFCLERGLRTLVRCDATALPFPNDAFDLVTALDVIEHLDDDEACLRELVRICRPGAHVLLHVPAFRMLWTDKDELSHHRRRYRRAEFAALVERCGIEIEKLFHINALLFPVALLRAGVQRIWRRPRQAPLAAASALDPLYDIPASLNRLMTDLMEVERRLITRVRVPFGLSLVCLARKPALGLASTVPADRSTTIASRA